MDLRSTKTRRPVIAFRGAGVIDKNCRIEIFEGDNNDSGDHHAILQGSKRP